MSRLFRRIFPLLAGTILLSAWIPTIAQPATSPAHDWPAQVYAPYIYPNFLMTTTAERTGLRCFTLAFVLNGVGECNARWNGSAALDQFYFVNDLEALRGLGGEVIVSFGGAAGDELALVCPDVASLMAAYQTVIDKLAVTHLDFDIEGDEIEDAASIQRRSEAIAALQAANPELVVSFTLPTATRGLTDSGLAVLDSALEHGVEIALVNIMTMNFGDDDDSTMADRTIRAAESLFDQLAVRYPDLGEAELWAKIGLTPMIGVNNRVEEIFTLDDAEIVLAFAQARGIGRIAMWSVERDRACGGGVQTLSPDCSGLAQEDDAFSAIFQQFTTPPAEG